MAIFRLKHNPANGDVAIYSVPSHASEDNAPLTAPFANVSRLQFHSGMILPSTTAALTKQVSVTIPQQAANAKFQGQINLFAHGKGQPCMVEGRIINLDGVNVDLNGSVPVFSDARGFATFVALAANNTHVVLVYFGIVYGGGQGTPRPAQTFTVEASAYDFLSTGPADTSNPALPRLRINENFGTMGRGKFDTRRRFLRQTTAAGDKPLALDATMSVVGGPGPSSGNYAQQQVGWRWRYSCGGYVKQTTVGWNGSATNGGTRNASFIRVKR